MNGDRELRSLVHPDQWARCRHEGTAPLPDGGVTLAWDDAPGRGHELEAASGSVPPGAGLAFDRWCRGYLTGPRTGAAVDTAQRLYVADTADGAVRVADLWAQRLLRRIAVGGPHRRNRRPVDVAADGPRVRALLDGPPGLLELDGRRNPYRGPRLDVPCHPAHLRPRRLALREDLLLVLWSDRDTGDALVTAPDGSAALRVPGATDLDLTADATLVVGRRPGQSFRRWQCRGRRWVELSPLRAEGYDGGALCVTPDDRIAFTTAAGWGRTGGSAARYVRSGTVLSYRLDSGGYRTRWGRVFVEGCIPAGTTVTLRFLTTDDDDVNDPTELLATLPERPGRLVERTEPSWPGDAPGQLYETPVVAPAGRYLWVVAELTGTARTSPRVTALRIEAPGHRLDRALPRSWTAREDDAAYLQRYLTPAEGLLHDLDCRAALRDVLLDPTSSPAESLAWLGSFLGLALDQAWPEEARRELVASAFDLYRIRGTQACLERLLRLYLQVPVTVVENWRLRGLAGGVLSAPTTGPRPPAVGAGTPHAGQLGRFTVGGVLPEQDGYTATAHRFSVLVGSDLTPARLEVVRRIVESHKPAHTLAEICQFGRGMRLGSSTRTGLTAFVGPSTRWAPAVVGQVAVGGDGIVGIPGPGTQVAKTTQVGEVRVG